MANPKPNQNPDATDEDPPEAPEQETNQDSTPPPEDQSAKIAEMQQTIQDLQEITARQEQERQSRGMAGQMVADRGETPNPQEDRLAFMEAIGTPPYLIEAEKKSMAMNRQAWGEQLATAKRQGSPTPVAATITPPEGGEMLSNAQQENDRIMMARMELAMDNPPMRNGRTLEERILTQPDETVPGGFYIIDGRKVDANGRILA